MDEKVQVNRHHPLIDRDDDQLFGWQLINPYTIYVVNTGNQSSFVFQNVAPHKCPLYPELLTPWV